MKNAFLLAAASSGSGKTTLTIGLLRAFSQKGMKVQPFKCGPDFIDPQYHSIAAGRESVNLDTWMASPEHVRKLFSQYAADADISIVEGVMGLYDGADGMQGSSAEIAELLGIPVILIIDARSMAHSLAPLLYGYRHYRPQTHIAGIILNNVGSPHHEAILRKAAAEVGMPVLGTLPRMKELYAPSRHLGLDISERNRISDLAQRVADGPSHKGRGVDSIASRILSDILSVGARPSNVTTPRPLREELGEGSLREGPLIYIAKDDAFNFLYRETVDQLSAMGEVRFFSPLKNEAVPLDADLVYLPGGYPEFFVEQLAQSRQTMESLRQTKAIIWAECGGMMYLSQGIDEADMAGILPFRTTMQNAHLHLGYRQMTFTDPYTGKSVQLRGHEFHYSSIMGTPPPSAVQLYDAKGNPVDTGFYIYNNVYAGYTHWALPQTLLPYILSVDKSKRGDKMGEMPRESIPTTHEKCLPLQGDERAALMLAGTGSDVGKSVLATALCRIFLQDGYRPAPFKAQNMALNSAATADGYEIGRAQMVQAEAARVVATTDMNPLLLKPNSEHTTQVVLNGKPIGNRNAYDYFRKEGREELRKEVNAAFDRLATQYNPIVMEGAGSICELNLMETDLVNMPMARHANAKVILVCDIDRGGVFAQAYGSIMLQKPEDRKRIIGIIVNKFRGDIRLFEDGRRMLEEICQVPVLGVIPYLKDVKIEAEDSMDLQPQTPQPPKGGDIPTDTHEECLRETPTDTHEECLPLQGVGGSGFGSKFESKFGSRSVQVAVVLLRHISNFTDFDRLQNDPRVNLYYVRTPQELKAADIIILPGTKSTLADLYELQENGMKEAIFRAHREGKRIVGICGGYQMLGQSIEDPDGIEGSIARLPGIGIFPFVTTMSGEKTTCQTTFSFEGQPCKGYEIHQGRTSVNEESSMKSEEYPRHQQGQLSMKSEEITSPYVLQDNALGTYIHGILDNPPVIDWLLAPFTDRHIETEDYDTFKQRQYDLLADHVRAHLNMPLLYKLIKG